MHFLYYTCPQSSQPQTFCKVELKFNRPLLITCIDGADQPARPVLNDIPFRADFQPDNTSLPSAGCTRQCSFIHQPTALYTALILTINPFSKVCVVICEVSICHQFQGLQRKWSTSMSLDNLRVWVLYDFQSVFQQLHFRKKTISFAWLPFISLIHRYLMVL